MDMTQKAKGAKDIKHILKNAGYKATLPRLKVLSLLHKTAVPLSINDIVKKLRGTADKVTVYRVLDAFKKSGLVRQVDFQHDAAYFELHDKERDHHHVICVKCDRIEDFTGCESEKLAEKALRQTRGFSEITNHSFEFFGLCMSCVISKGK